MNISNRDYNILTDQETQEWIRIKKMESSENFSNILSHTTSKSILEYPKVFRHHFFSLFPNNYLDVGELQEKNKIESLINQFSLLINKESTKEREIINFINNEQAHFIIGSILKKGGYDFGHHGAYIFPEFELGNSYRVDFLIIGKNSGGYEFIFVELENVNGRITNRNGEFGEVIRKGETQINNWREWIEGNYSALSESFEKLKNPDRELSKEFYKLDTFRIHFSIIAGKRKDFNDKTNKLRRKYRRESSINLFHYNNLEDFSKYLIGTNTY
ncbi:MAG: hypothetical protein ACFCUV_06755 [Rivularia sp. (in: cyanobacteria)]